jgi:hypothetical protein
VIDGPNNLADYPSWDLKASSGQSISLSCESPVEYGPPLVGERGDSFVVSLRLQVAAVEAFSKMGLNPVRRTGYNELSSALWHIRNTNSCIHDPNLGEEISLGPGCMAITGFDERQSIVGFGRIVIFLTAGNPVSRWRAILSLAQDTSNEGFGYIPVMLRGRDCCLRCAVEQTLKRAGTETWAIVL